MLKEYKKGIDMLRNEDNASWVDIIRCWAKEENDYSIFIFQVTVQDEKELKKVYNSISAAIALEFQSTLEKNIERWNIYLIYVVREEVSIKVKELIEQDKYSSRKLVWDKLIDCDIENIIEERLFTVNVKKRRLANLSEEEPMQKLIERKYRLIYNVLVDNQSSIEEKTQNYLGGKVDE